MLIGITGGIATGKSQVTRLFAAKGATTFSADEAARAVLTPGGPVLHDIVRIFGPEMLRADGQLDRSRLAGVIFADTQARETLNRIMHPPIRRLLRDQIEAAQDDLSPESVIAVEIPLLFENSLEDWFERIVVVIASEPIQKKRLCARNGLSESEAEQRLAAQWPLADKAARADDVLMNDGTLHELAQQVDALWQRLIRISSRKTGKKSGQITNT